MKSKMTNKTNLLSVVAVSAMVLTGCNTVKQPAGDTLKKAMVKSTKYDSYNFSVTQKIGLTELKGEALEEAKKYISEEAQAGSKKPAAKSLSTCDADLDKALENKTDYDIAEKKYLSCIEGARVDSNNSTSTKNRFISSRASKEIKKLMTPERIKSIDKYILQPLSSSVSGAVNRKSKEAQLNYTLSYRPKNLDIAVTFPMLLNFKELSITLDPSLALPILSVMYPEQVGTQWEGKGVKFYIPKKYTKEIPSELILNALTDSLIKNYQQLPNDLFSYKGKSSNVIQLNLNSQQQINLLDSFLKEWIAEVDRQVKENPDAVKDMRGFQQMFSILKETTAEGIFTNKSLLSKFDIEPAELVGTYKSQFTLDGKGNIVAGMTEQTHDMINSAINAKLFSTSNLTMTNINRAKFTFRPQGSDVIDGNQLVKHGFRKVVPVEKSEVEKVVDVTEEVAATDVATDVATVVDATKEAATAVDVVTEAVVDPVEATKKAKKPVPKRKAKK